MVTCKVTGKDLKDCEHCKAKCSKSGVPVGMCAHCNVSAFGDPVVRSTPGNKRSSVTKHVTDHVLTYDLTSPNCPDWVKKVSHELFPDGPGDPTEIYCDFCGEIVNPNRLTTGLIDIKKVRGTEVTERDNQGNPVKAEPKIGHIPINAVACHNCAHLIKPLVRKDGSVKHQGTVLPRVID